MITLSVVSGLVGSFLAIGGAPTRVFVPFLGTAIFMLCAKYLP